MGNVTNTDELKSWLVDLRRYFHRNAELSGHENNTSLKVAQVLTDLGVEVQTFDDTTGVVGLIRGSNTAVPMKGTIALRADMDALPLEEETGQDYASRTKGVMHACGHDANTAIALGVARLIKESGFTEEINGAVKFIFQPSEERLGGALAMIGKGVLEDPKVDRVIAGHMDPNFPVGKVGVFQTKGHAASDSFELTICGNGGHGARPHKGRSPITAGALFVNQLDTIIPRRVPPVHSAVISVGVFQAGEAANVIPGEAVIRGTIRTHDPDVREMIFQEMEDLAKGVGTLAGVTCNLSIKAGAPMGINDESVSRSLYEASVYVLGEEQVTVLPFIMGSDDFYFFGRHCPVAMMRLGCADRQGGAVYPLHSSKFDIHEDVLEEGARVLFKAVQLFFE